MKTVFICILVVFIFTITSGVIATWEDGELNKSDTNLFSVHKQASLSMQLSRTFNRQLFETVAQTVAYFAKAGGRGSDRGRTNSQGL